MKLSRSLCPCRLDSLFDRLVVHESFEFSRAYGVLEFAYSFGFNLSYALASYLKYPAYLFEGVCVAVTDAVSQLDNLAFAIGQGFQDVLDTVFKHLLSCRLDGRIDGFILYEISEVAVFAFAYGPVETEWMLGNF